MLNEELFYDENEIDFTNFLEISKRISYMDSSAIRKLTNLGFNEYDDTYFSANECPQIENNKGLFLIGDENYGACHIWKTKNGYCVHLTDMLSISDRFYFFKKIQSFIDFIKRILK